MKILFGYINSSRSFDLPMGIAYLSAMLKTHGHQTSLLDMTWPEDLKTPSFWKDYDLLAMSATTLDYADATAIARLWKGTPNNTDRPVILGGCKAITEPEKSIRDPSVDAICIGEGEHALLEFIDKYENTKQLPITVENFWVKREDKIYRNPLRPLIEDLDTLPFPDRSIFDKRHIELYHPGTAFLTSRGCPYHCSECINHYLQKLYAGLGSYTRFRTPDNILAEISQVREQYKIKRIFFIDDTFTLNGKGLKVFLHRYGKEVGLPFLIMGRCNTVTREMIQDLKDAGCIYVGYGIESGNLRVRNEILKRDMTDEQIINAFRWTHEAGIETASYNMIGIPTETRKEMFETIRLNKKVHPSIVQTALLYPFPKTEIYDLADRKGLLEDPDPEQTDYFRRSIIKTEMSEKDLYGLSALVPLYVHLPTFLWPLVRPLEWLVARSKKLDSAIRLFYLLVLERRFYKRVMKP